MRKKIVLIISVIREFQKKSIRVILLIRAS